MEARIEDFLAEERILDDCRAAAIIFKLAPELEKAMTKQKIDKAQMANKFTVPRWPAPGR